VTNIIDLDILGMSGAGKKKKSSKRNDGKLKYIFGLQQGGKAGQTGRIVDKKERKPHKICKKTESREIEKRLSVPCKKSLTIVKNIEGRNKRRGPIKGRGEEGRWLRRGGNENEVWGRGEKIKPLLTRNGGTEQSKTTRERG